MTEEEKKIEAQIAYEMGMIAYRRGDYITAEAEHKKLFDLDRTNPKYQNAYTRSYMALLNYQEKLEIERLTERIKLITNDAELYVDRGRRRMCKRDGGFFKRALGIADFTKAIELDPNNANAYRFRAIAYAKGGQCEKAIADYEKAVEICPNDKDICDASFLRVLCPKSRYAKPTEAEKIANIVKGWLHNGGDLFEKCADYSKEQLTNAILELDKTIDKMPNDYDSFFYRGCIYLILKENQKALNDFRKTLEINNCYHDAILGAETACVALGDQKGAEHYAVWYAKAS